MALENKMKQGKGYLDSAKRIHWSYQIPFFNNTRDDFTHGHHQKVNSEIRLIIVFAAEYGQAPYSQQNKTRS